MYQRIVYNWNIKIIAALFATLILVLPAHAATVTSANDYPTSLQSGQSGNHQVLFTTPSGVSEGATITLTFSSAFDTSSITEDDVDISDDAVDLTTASSCTGTERASVAMASDVLTITICAGDGGAIAASSQVAIEIGTNATSSGTGTNRIVNPTSPGTYFLTIGGTFGDSGSIAIPVSSSSNQVAVSVITPTISGGESGAGAPSAPAQPAGDTTAPTISNIVVSSVTTTSASISWATNEAADSAIDYGLTQSFELGTVTHASFLTAHSLGVSGLSEGKTYYFRVRSKDSSANQATSSTQSFSTLDETAPVISSINVVDITTTSARVTWSTNESTRGTIEYGKTLSYGLSKTSSAPGTSHSVILTGLSSGSLYHARVHATDDSSNTAVSSDVTFSTLADPAPANVTNLTVEFGDQQIRLSWINPPDADLAGIRVLECLSGFPSGPNQTGCVQAQNALTSTLTRTGLTNKTTYYYGVFAYDATGQFASGAVGSGTPTAPEEEVPPVTPPVIPKTPEVPPEEPSGLPGGEDTEPGADSEKGAGSGTQPQGGGVPQPEETPSSKPTALGAQFGSAVSMAQEAVLEREDLTITAGAGLIVLLPNTKGMVDVLPSTRVRFLMRADEISDKVEALQISIGSEGYLMRLVNEQGGDALYEADVITPVTPQLYILVLSAMYADKSSQSVSSFLQVVPWGMVTQNIDDEETLIEGVRVSLSIIEDGSESVWDGSPYGQFNPVNTGSSGTYGWYVPDGTYSVSATKLGFLESSTGAIKSTNHIVNTSLRLTAVPAQTLPSLIAPLRETVATVLQTPVLQTVNKTLETVREHPVVQEATDVATPVLVVSAGASVVVLTVAFDFIPFLQYFFTAPVLLFWRRKRKGYGVIYNAISRMPVDLAVVRLFVIEDETKSQTGRLLQSRVTDKAGRFFFLIQPGKYRLSVSKTGFQFPTEYLKSQKDDGVFLDVYHGEVVEVTEKDVVITPNIPLDPVQADGLQKSKQVVWQERLRAIQHLVAVSGVLVSVAVAIIRPNVLAVVMIGVQLLVYGLARRLAKPRKSKSWGIVYDKQTRRPLANVIARIFEPRYNKLLDTQVTDARGRYAFLLGPSEYFAVFEKDGYLSTQVRPIDFREAKGAQDFSVDVEMQPKGGT